MPVPTNTLEGEVSHTSVIKNDAKQSSSLTPCKKGLIVATFSLSLIAVGVLVGSLSNSNKDNASESALRGSDADEVPTLSPVVSTTAAADISLPTAPTAQSISESTNGRPDDPGTVPEKPESMPEPMNGSTTDPVTVPAIETLPVTYPTSTALDPMPEDPMAAFCGANPSSNHACARVDINIVYDDRSDESSYDLTKINTATGDNVLTSYEPGRLVWEREESLCLEEGTYRFTMYDDGENGIRGWVGDGYYEVTSHGEMLAEGADWRGYKESTVFDINVNDQFEQAKSIASGITPLEVLENASSPQSKALQWIVCQDQVSYELFRNANPSTGLLPLQVHGSSVGGDSGESQVLRRYALATFFFATSEEGPWSDQWSFLSENEHECSWHRNVTRVNVPFGEFDPSGFICMHPKRSLEIMLDDMETEIGNMTLNFRVPNNLTGAIPPELGYIQGITSIVVENQNGVYSPIP